jgi:hypothetical protein
MDGLGGLGAEDLSKRGSPWPAKCGVMLDLGGCDGLRWRQIRHHSAAAA